MTTTDRIRTRYVNHPGSNVGAYVARAAGRQARVRTDQRLTSEENHRRAADILASRLGVAIYGATATDEGYTFDVVGPRDHDDAAELTRTARRLFRDHGHEWTFDDKEEEEMTRENCGACALNGYGARRTSREEGVPIQPNYAGWARDYVQARREIPAVYFDAFRAELDSDNRAYARELARDVLTYGVRFGRHVCPTTGPGTDTPTPIVTCGNCGREWCDACDPAPAALCHYCHGRGYSTAPHHPSL